MLALEKGGRRRRSWSLEEKRRIVAETFAPGASVSVVVRRHDRNANMLFTWRRELATAEAQTSEETTASGRQRPGAGLEAAPRGKLSVIEGGLPTEVLVSQVAVARYADHQPL